MIAQIMYKLLQSGMLAASDPMALWLMEESSHMDELEAMAADFNCRIIAGRDMLLLVPEEDNTFIGFSKADLKEQLLKSQQTDVHYYLLMFMLLVLLDAFYSTEYGDGQLRDFLFLGDWMNRTDNALRAGLNLEDNPGNIPYEEMQDTYSNLLSEMDSAKRGTKLQLYQALLRFLQQQDLVIYLEERKLIYVTPRMNALIDSILRNDEILACFEALPSLEVEQEGIEDAEA